MLYSEKATCLICQLAVRFDDCSHFFHEFRRCRVERFRYGGRLQVGIEVGILYKRYLADVEEVCNQYLCHITEN